MEKIEKSNGNVPKRKPQGRTKTKDDFVYNNEQFVKKFPNALRIKGQVQGPAKFGKLQSLLKTIYETSSRDHLQPSQVYDKVKLGVGGYDTLYKQLKFYAQRPAFKLRIQQAISGKVVHQLSKKMKIPLKQAMCILLLDDFWDHLKVKTNNTHHKLKQFADDNKLYVKDLVTNILKKQIPQARDILQQDRILYGGAINSQDPYISDAQYMKYIFGLGSTKPCPRYQSQYMYQMASRIQVPVTSTATGQAICVIVPQSCVFGSGLGDSSRLPFVWVSSTNASTPYSSSPAFTANGPFSGQNQNFVTYALDSCSLDFIQTESPLTVRGKLEISFYYQPPNQTWKRGYSSPGLYAPAAISITDSQITNNVGYVSRRANADMMKLTRLGTWIPDESRLDLIPMQATSVYSDTMMNQQPFIILKWTGCTPSVNIGTLFITSAISVEPIAQMRGILSVAPRGSYQGTFRILRQARKNGINLQFLQTTQALQLCKQFSSEVNYGNIQHFGGGQAQPIQGYNIVYNPNDNGFCVYQCLKRLGYQVERKPWLGAKLLSQLHVPYLIYKNGKIGYMSQQTSYFHNSLICLNSDTKHAYIISKIITQLPLLQAQFHQIYGQGQAQQLNNFQILYDPKQDGYCVSSCLQYCDVMIPHRKYMTPADLVGTHIPFIIYQKKRISHVCSNDSRSNAKIIVFNRNTKHAYVVKWIGSTSINHLMFSQDAKSFTKCMRRDKLHIVSPILQQKLIKPTNFLKYVSDSNFVDRSIAQNCVMNAMMRASDQKLSEGLISSFVSTK